MRSQLVVVRVRMTEKNLLLGRKQRGIRELMKESMCVVSFITNLHYLRGFSPYSVSRSQKRIQKIPEITIISGKQQS